MLATERGGSVAWELWRYCRAVGKTPQEALRDPDLAFNLTVMRAHDQARRMRFALRLQLAQDPLGAAIQMIYEDA